MASIEEMKEVVKRIPIPEYLHGIVVPSLKGYYGAGEGYFEYSQFERCPFHNEDTGSFKYYSETNSCYCFGCGIGGDIFALHKKFIEDNTGNEPTFSEVLTELYNWAQTQDIEQHSTVEQVYQQNKLEDWQAQNKIALLLIKSKLTDKFKTANMAQYLLLCELEKIINNTQFDIKEMHIMLDKLNTVH